jgi:hypothetical protein
MGAGSLKPPSSLVKQFSINESKIWLPVEVPAFFLLLEEFRQKREI